MNIRILCCVSLLLASAAAVSANPPAGTVSVAPKAPPPTNVQNAITPACQAAKADEAKAAADQAASDTEKQTALSELAAAQAVEQSATANSLQEAQQDIAKAQTAIAKAKQDVLAALHERQDADKEITLGHC